MSHDHGEVFSAGHELDEASVPALLISAVLIVLLIVVSCIGVALQMKMLAAIRPNREAMNAPDISSLPAHVIDWSKPSVDLAVSRAREKEKLHSYGWIDQPAGVVRIPIEHAMALVARQAASPSASQPAPESTSQSAQPAPSAEAAR